MTSVPQPESASLSYRRGADVPLLELTLSQALSHTAARFPGRAALVVCHQNVHLTWSELDAEVTRTARGLAGLGLQCRRPRRHLGQQLSRVGAAPVRDCPRRAHPGQRQPGLPLARAALRAAKVAHPRPLPARARIRARTTARSSRDSRNGDRLPLEHVVWLGEDSWRRDDRSGARLSGARRHAGRRRQHPVHFRHHRLAQGRDADASQPAQQRHGDRDRASLHGRRPHLRAGPALPLLRIGDRLHGLGGQWRGSDSALGAVRRSGHSARPYTGSAPPRSTACPPCSSRSWSIPSSTASTCSSLRKGVMSGAPCPIELMKRVGERMHIERMTIPYGQTESSPVITMSNIDDPFELRVTTVGAPLANTEVQIVDPETRAPAPYRAAGRAVHPRLPGDERLRRRSAKPRPRRSTATAGCTPATSP